MKLAEREVVATIGTLHLRELRLWVRQGWIRPAQGESGPLFDDLDIARVRLICDLRGGMAVPAEAIPMVLSLLDQVHGLRAELRALAEAIQRQPEDTRKAVLAAHGGDTSRR